MIYRTKHIYHIILYCMTHNKINCRMHSTNLYNQFSCLLKRISSNVSLLSVLFSDHCRSKKPSWSAKRGLHQMLTQATYCTNATLCSSFLLNHFLFYDLIALLHNTALHYITLHYTTLHYTTLHYTILHYTTLHYTTLHYTTQPISHGHIQDYEGREVDITITPWTGHLGVLSAFSASLKTPTEVSNQRLIQLIIMTNIILNAVIMRINIIIVYCTLMFLLFKKMIIIRRST